MTHEDKELLLKDLSARLPYGVKYECSDIKNIWKLNSILTKRQDDGVFLDIYNPLDLCKPHLFPLSSMTDKQKTELKDIFSQETAVLIERVKNNDCGIDCGKYHFHQILELDWLLKNHFDYNGLIEKGLAIDATNKNIY